MKVGDLVEHRRVQKLATIVEVWRVRGKINAIDVMWWDQGNKVRGYRPSLFRVVNEV